MIALASDHAGFALKEKLKNHLKENGYEYLDLGTDSEQSCHYPVFAKKLCEKINDGTCELGILVCGTGIGMSMVANKVEGVRAALCSDCFSAQATREHNNANVLCMGARTIGPGLALMIVDKFVDTPFSNDERHVRRIKMFS